MGPGNISPLDWFIAFIAAEFLVMPLVTLVHEMGHAAVALRVSSGIVVVVVGKPSTAIQILFERLKVIWSPVPERLTLEPRPAGVCRYDQANVKPRDKMLVTLAGPFATALLIPIFIWATVECAEMPQWIPATWGLSAGCRHLNWPHCRRLNWPHLRPNRG